MALITLAWAVTKTMKILLWQCLGKVSNQELHLHTSETPLIGPACFVQVFPLILQFVFTVHLCDKYKAEVESTYTEESELLSFSIHKWLSDAWCRNYLPGKDSSPQSFETFISWASSVKTTLPQPILLAPLLHYLAIHISVSVMARFLNLYVLLASHTHHIYDLPV